MGFEEGKGREGKGREGRVNCLQIRGRLAATFERERFEVVVAQARIIGGKGQESDSFPFVRQKVLVWG